MPLDVRAQVRDHAVGDLSGTEPQTESGRRPGDDLVGRSLDRMTVDPDDRHARTQPQSLVQGETRVAHKMHARTHAH